MAQKCCNGGGGGVLNNTIEIVWHRSIVCSFIGKARKSAYPLIKHSTPINSIGRLKRFLIPATSFQN